ncbi:MAG TPA: hypothetical protein VGK25_00265 [Ignavibacteria bacterium]
MKLKPIAALFFALLTLQTVKAQINDDENQVKLDLDNISFLATYDTTNFCSDFTVSSKDNGIIHREECIERITSITAEDLNADGNKEILIETYTGGAHCCTSLYIASIKHNIFKYTDTVYWGNCGFEVKDLNNDGKKEIIGCNDMFAYYFTNFAESRFPMIIYGFKKNSLIVVNKNFKALIHKEINELKAELKDYLKKGFDCPKKADGKYEVFNTDAGSVQAILGAIVANYQSIGETDEAFDYVGEVYKCPDKANFIKILKNDFKLK